MVATRVITSWAVLLVAACGSSPDRQPTSQARHAYTVSFQAPERAASASRTLASSIPAAARAPDGAPDAEATVPASNAIAASDSGSGRLLVRSATASLQVDSLSVAFRRLNTLAGALGGFIGNTAIEAGLDQLHSADLDVHVPANRFEDLLDGLRRVGTLATLDVRTQDAGEEYVDVGARLRNASRLEHRLLDLLATRSGRLSDVLEIERALAAVREDIERLEGRVRYLRSHAAMSDITVTIHEPGVAVGGATSETALGGAAVQAWKNFLYLLVFAIQAIGVVVPLVGIALLGWVIRRRWGPAGDGWVRLRHSVEK